MHSSRHKARPVLKRPGWFVFGLAGAFVLITAVVWSVGVSSNEFQEWFEDETHGDWTVMYTGYGQVTTDGEHITLEPKAAADHAMTHGGLVHTVGQCRDADFSMTVHTESQVRQGNPNVWEVGWVLWNFQSDTHFYAVALKPNGWEISKQDPNYPGNQRFLATGDSPQFPIGRDYRVSVTQNDGAMTVSANGEELAVVIDEETPYREGAIGLYTEDARVHFSDFDLPDCARSH